MSAPRPSPPLRVPTLTEVVEFEAPPNPNLAPVVQAQAPAPAAAEPFDARDLTVRILARVQQQLDASFESGLRETIAPALARCADGLIHELQAEIVSTLQGLVARAVEHERARAGEPAAAAPRRDGGTTPD